MKRGIVGGTFDPIHVGHLRLAIEALEYFELDEVVIEPANQSPLKDSPPLADANLRQKMVAVAVEGEPKLRAGCFEASRPGPSYTIDTVGHYSGDGVEIFLVVGADALASLPKWKEPEKLFEMCRVAGAVRGAEDAARALESLPKEWQTRVQIFPSSPLFISSTEVRSRLREGRSIRYLVPDSAIRIIREERLYL